MTETAADDLRESLAPVSTPDLDTYLGAIGSMFQPVEDLARDTDDGEGWTPLLDANRAPAAALPWLAQFVGVRLMAGLTDAERRRRIAETDGFRRGSLAGVAGAAAQHLTGTRAVVIRERDGGAYRLTVITYTGQTPDAALVEAALAEQKPAGIVLDYRVIPGQDYTLLRTENATYGALRDAFATYEAVRENV